MWFKTIFRRQNKNGEAPLFDEAFLRRMERLSIQAQRTLRGHPSSGEHLSRRQVASTIFSDHRPYTSGDDLRYVDWNAYARQEHVLVKLGEAEQDVDVHIVIDSSSSMRWGDPPKLRVAQRLAGAIGYLALAHSDRLRIIPFAQQAAPMFGPIQGKARMPQMLQFVAGLSPTASRNDPKDLKGTALTEVLIRHGRTHPRGGILVLCSDMLVPDGLLEGLRALPPPRWQVIVMHLLDPDEIAPSLQGPLELEDSETGERLPLTLDEPTLAAYDRNLRAWQEQISSACARRGASYARIITNWPLEKQVIPYLRTRRILT